MGVVVTTIPHSFPTLPLMGQSRIPCHGRRTEAHGVASACTTAAVLDGRRQSFNKFETLSASSFFLVVCTDVAGSNRAPSTSIRALCWFGKGEDTELVN